MQISKLGIWRLRALLAVIGLLITTLSYSQTIQLTQLRVQRKPHHWRFMFEANGPIQYKIFSLSNPTRIAIDMRNVKLKHLFHRALYVDTPVNTVRIGKPQPGKLRLVLDLDHAVTVKSFVTMPEGTTHYRLVVDMFGKKPHVTGFNWPASHASTEPPAPTPTQSDLSTVHMLPAPEQEQPYLSETAPVLKSARPVIVVIDAGHGGKDPGATGARGTREKNVVLQIAREVQQEIDQQRGFKAVLTRDADYYLPLRQRLEVARRYKADMFISIHADAYRDRYARGASIYALSQRGATNEAARWLAQQENQSEFMGGVNMSDKNDLLRSVLINLSQTASIRASLQVGQEIIHFLKRITPLHYTRIGQAAFVVLKAPDVPSILMESGFISNPDEERKLNSADYRRELANAVTLGVKDYFMTNPPRGTWLASQQRHKD